MQPPIALLALAALGLSPLAGCSADAPATEAAAGAAGTAGVSGHGGSAQGGAGAAGHEGGAAGALLCLTAEECQAAGFATPPGEGQPPAPLDGAPLAEGVANVQAVYEIFLGDTDRQGVASPDAWMGYGFDLDGWNSTPEQGFHCRPAAGGKRIDSQNDGPGGLDNSFGRNFMDILKSVVPAPSARSSMIIQSGGFSSLIELEKLGAGASYHGLAGGWWPAIGTRNDKGEPVDPTNQWSDGSYEWHPLAEQINPDGSPVSALTDAYLVGRTLVARPAGPLFVQLSPGLVLNLRIEKPILSLHYSEDGSQGATGNLGGILDTEQLIKKLWKDSDPYRFGSVCFPDGENESVSDQVRQMSDIMIDGTQDPTKVCNGISVGLGFTTRAAKRSDPAAPVPPGPCD